MHSRRSLRIIVLALVVLLAEIYTPRICHGYQHSIGPPTLSNVKSGMTRLPPAPKP